MREHTEYKCPEDCSNPCCSYCYGGLFTCIVCGGTEGSLPTECPGRCMTVDEKDKVYAGKLDYVNNKWVKIIDINTNKER